MSKNDAAMAPTQALDEYHPEPVEARYTSVGPYGAAMKLPGHAIADFSAMLTSAGFEKEQVASFLHLIQTIAVKTNIEMLPQILEEMQNMWRARIGAMMAEVRAMPEAYVHVPWTQRLVPPQGPIRSLVDRESILQAMARWMDKPPRTA